MTINLKVKPPAWFWVVGVLALLWNLLGVSAYLGEAFMSVEAFGKLPVEQRELFQSRPAWATAAYAIAVWGGALGCIALLMRKKWAVPVLLVSLIGILLQNVYQFFMSEAFEVYGATAMFLPVLVIVVGILLVLFARLSLKKGWIS